MITAIAFGSNAKVSNESMNTRILRNLLSREIYDNNCSKVSDKTRYPIRGTEAGKKVRLSNIDFRFIGVEKFPARCNFAPIKFAPAFLRFHGGIS